MSTYATRPKLCGGYQVEPDGDHLVVTCRSCGRMPVSRAAATSYVDPIVGLEGPAGRFLVHATRRDRAELAAQLRRALGAS